MFLYTFRSLFLSHFLFLYVFSIFLAFGVVVAVVVVVDVAVADAAMYTFVESLFGFHRSSRSTHTQQLETFDKQRDCENCVQSVSPCNVTPCLMVLSYYFFLRYFFSHASFLFTFFLASLSCFELIHHILNHFHFVFER